MNRYQFEAKLQSNQLASASAQAGDPKPTPLYSSAYGKQPQSGLSAQSASAKAG